MLTNQEFSNSYKKGGIFKENYIIIKQNYSLHNVKKKNEGGYNYHIFLFITISALIEYALLTQFHVYNY